MEYEAVIGLEVHVQLNTKSKIFCSCSTEFGAKANSQTCPVCLALPGVLPVLNTMALEKGIKAGLAINCDIAQYSKFDRKNYFYPDLPKAYQISQYDKPICSKGHIDIQTENGPKRIGITRLHLEEDAGKSIHSETPTKNVSYVDLNRCGVPLAEIVSEPDLSTAEEASQYLQKLRSIMKYIDVSDVNMEEGSLRCDVNISIREKGTEPLGQKVELKNLNSFKSVRNAINFEIKRQTRLKKKNETIVQETRLWDADKGETYSMRSKEEAHDYRYFPDPDLPPVILEKDYIEKLRQSLPELPDTRKTRFIKDYDIPEYDAEVLTSTRQLADFYEETVTVGSHPKKTSNWIMSELLGHLDEAEKVYESNITPVSLAELLILIDKGTISGKIAKKVFLTMIETGEHPDKIVKDQGLVQVTDVSSLEPIIDRIISENPDSVQDYKNGKEKAIGFLVGQVMKESKGKANPQIVNQLLKEKLQ